MEEGGGRTPRLPPTPAPAGILPRERGRLGRDFCGTHLLLSSFPEGPLQMEFARQRAGASRALGGSRPAPPGPSPWLLTPEARLLRGLLVGRPPRASTQPVSRAAGDSSTRRVQCSPLSVPCGARVPSPLVPRPFCHVALPRALCVAPRWFPARPALHLRADCASGETPPRAGSAAAGRHAAAPRGRGGSGRVGAVVGDVGRGTCGCRGSQRGSSSKHGTLPRDPAARCCVYTRERRRRGLEEAVTHPCSRQVRREGGSPQVSLRRQRDEPNVVRLQP